MTAHRKFYTSLSLLLILNLLIKPLWIFGIDRVAQNQAGMEAYGNYFAVLGLCSVLGFLLDWGLTSFYNRELAAENKAVQLGSLLGLKLIFSLIYAFAVILIAWISGLHQPVLIAGLIAVQILNSFFLFFRAIVTAEQWFTTDAWLSVLDKTLMIALCLYFILARTMTMPLFLLLQIAATGAAVLVVIIVLRKRNYSLRPAHPFRLSKPVFHAALPFAIIVLLMSAHNRLDGFLIERLRSDGSYQSGLYAASYRLLDACNMAGYLLATFLLPYIARRFSRQESFAEPVLQARHILIPFSVGVAALAIFSASPLQHILYPKAGADLWPVLQWGLPALIGYSFTQIYGTVLTATGQIRLFSLIVAVSLLINIVLNLLLIPSLGAKGACIAAIISQSACGLATFIAGTSKNKLPYGFVSLTGYGCTALLLTLYFYSIRNLQLSFLTAAGGAVLITVVILLAGGWLRFSRLKNINNDSSS